MVVAAVVREVRGLPEAGGGGGGEAGGVSKAGRETDGEQTRPQQQDQTHTHTTQVGRQPGAPGAPGEPGRRCNQLCVLQGIVGGVAPPQQGAAGAAPRRAGVSPPPPGAV